MKRSGARYVSGTDMRVWIVRSRMRSRKGSERDVVDGVESWSQETLKRVDCFLIESGEYWSGRRLLFKTSDWFGRSHL